MAKDKKQSRRISDMIMMLLIAISVILVLLELATNISAAMMG